MKKMLRGQALADEYARRHPLSEMNPGKVWATYEGGGWIRLRGDGLRSRPELADLFPNGWTLGLTLRSSHARKELRTRFRTLRKSYEEVGLR